MSQAILQKGNGVLLKLHIQPGAKRTEFVGLHGEAYKLRIHAPPVDGKANKMIQTFLSDFFGIAKSSVQIISGETGRLKTVYLEGISQAQVQELINKLA